MRTLQVNSIRYAALVVCVLLSACGKFSADRYQGSMRDFEELVSVQRRDYCGGTLDRAVDAVDRMEIELNAYLHACKMPTREEFGLRFKILSSRARLALMGRGDFYAVLRAMDQLFLEWKGKVDIASPADRNPDGSYNLDLLYLGIYLWDWCPNPTWEAPHLLSRVSSEVKQKIGIKD